MKGLVNHGNTCYFNSAIQCLLQVPCFANHLILSKYHGDDPLITELQMLTKEMWIRNKDSTHPVDPRVLLGHFVERHPQFVRGRQHDVQEAFLALLDDVEKEIPQTKEMFYSNVEKEVVCPSGRKVVEEKMMCHFLYPQPGDDIGMVVGRMSEWGSVEGYEDDDGKRWNVAATRTMIKGQPKLVVFSMGVRNRMDVLPHLVINEATYSLITTAVHVGVQAGGHYGSFGKHKGKWYLKDDESVRNIDFPYKGECHYLAIYYRQNS
jgi:ubiquitin C-terminal hydrolase